MELTKEMINCMRLPHTFEDGWTLSCNDCKVHRQGKVIREQGIRSISRRCVEWLNEQEKLLNK